MWAHQHVLFSDRPGPKSRHWLDADRRYWSNKPKTEKTDDHVCPYCESVLHACNRENHTASRASMRHDE